MECGVQAIEPLFLEASFYGCKYAMDKFGRLKPLYWVLIEKRQPNKTISKRAK